MLFLTIWIITITLCSTAVNGIRNVQLLIPPLVRAGSTATLLCLYDLEQSPLYSVKWYRGQHEFFRYMPSDNPPTKIFQIAGIYVDIFTSNQHQVTLHNVPTFISGEVSCEITTDAPAISTACVSDILKVQRMEIDLNIQYTEYRTGEQLIAECAASAPAKISFYLNSLRVPLEHVIQEYPNSGILNLTLRDEHFQPKGVLKVQCSGGISDQYYISTRTITIRHALDIAINDSQSLKIFQSDCLTAISILYYFHCSIVIN